VPAIIGTLVSARMATLHELQSVYGMSAAYDLLEVLSVDRYNHVLLSMPSGSR
jgi:hypothetical protein